MSEIITLELAETITERARETAQRTGESLEAILMRWLERGADIDLASDLIPDTEYPIYTPYGNEAAAQILTDFLNQTETEE